MYKLLIVDDEQIERQGLKMMIERLLTNVKVVAEAASGREAIEAIHQHNPDIVTMDIKMPGIDGLEAARHITKSHPAAKIVIFSAYDTFSYAQEAIQLGVKDYVLKPYSKDEVVKVLTRVINEIEQDRQEQEARLALNEQYNRIVPLAEAELVSRFIFRHIQEIPKQQLSELLNIEDGGCFVLLFRFWQEGASPLSQNLREHLYVTVKHVLKKSADCLVGPMVGELIPVAVFNRGEQVNHPTPRSQSLQLFRSFIRQFSPPFIEPTIYFAVGAGRKIASLNKLRNSYQEALLALERVERPQQICFYEDIENGGSSVSKVLLQKEKQLLEAVQQGDEADSVRLFDEIFYHKMTGVDAQLTDLARYMMGLFVMLDRVVDDFGENRVHSGDAEKGGAEASAHLRFDAYDSFEALHEAARAQLRQYVFMIEYSIQQQGGFLNKVRRYMETHYDKDISLETVAAHVGLSPYYFSKRFKQRTGINFVDALTTIRVEKAKQLLRTTDMSLKEICYKVGYRDPNYFSRVFKKAVAITPSQFRRKHRKKV